MSARLVLSGGIGSGKSTAAAVFSDLGAEVLVADDFARSVLAPGTDAALRVIELWPEVAVEGVIDRSRLGRLVFADPSHLYTLEAITHPPTRLALAEAVRRAPSETTVVVEMPILRDWFNGWTVVVVDAPDELRVARAVARSDLMVERDVRAVMERQPSRSEWLLAADFVIDNSGDEARLEQECRTVWDRVTNG